MSHADPAPPITGVHETVLYAEGLDAAHAFYSGVLGLRHVGEGSERGRAFRVNDAQVLLVFKPGLTRQSHALVPSHGCEGAGHVALSVPAESLDLWQARLIASGLTIEREVAWPIGGRSIYVRDPAGNSVELVEGQVWPA